MARSWTEDQFQRAVAAYLNGDTTLPRMREEFGVPAVSFAEEARRRGIPIRPKGSNMIGVARERHPTWRGGKRITDDGYVRTYAPEHPFGARSRGYVLEHVRVMELHMGRRLRPGEVVHHRDENKQNNAIENLELLDHREHVREHRLAEGDVRERDDLGRYR